MKVFAGLADIARAALGSLLRLTARFPAFVAQALIDKADAIDPPREWQPRLWDRGQDARSETEERRP